MPTNAHFTAFYGIPYLYRYDKGEDGKLVINEEQAEILKRGKRKARYSGSGIFSTKVICGDCGEFYGSKVWHSNDKYRKRIYQCNAKFKDEHKCRTPHLTEEELKTVFCMAMNDIFDIKDELIENISLIITTLDNSAMFESKRDEVNNEIEMVVQMMRKIS